LLGKHFESLQEPFKFVIGHELAYPQFRRVGDSLDAIALMRDHFWQILSEKNVTAFICGHTHSIYTDLIDGVYQVNAGHVKKDLIDVTIIDVDSDVMTARLFSTNGRISTAKDEFDAIVLKSNADKGKNGSGVHMTGCYNSVRFFVQ